LSRNELLEDDSPFGDKLFTIQVQIILLKNKSISLPQKGQLIHRVLLPHEEFSSQRLPNSFPNAVTTHYTVLRWFWHTAKKRKRVVGFIKVGCNLSVATWVDK
jgi:hypothetical protein